MVSLEFNLEGTEALSSRLHEKAESLRSGLAEALREIGELIVDNAQANAPVDTGYLRDHITIQDSSDDSVTVVSEAEYSSFVENGTSRMSAQPFFEPAINEARSQMGQILRDAMSL